jgi:hypothetical protein
MAAPVTPCAASGAVSAAMDTSGTHQRAHPNTADGIRERLHLQEGG